MSRFQHEEEIDFTVDRQNLFREEQYTDMNMATIRRLIPIKTDGTQDPDREILFLGYTQLMTPGGPIPVQCLLEAKTLEGAVAEYPSAMKEALDQIIEELQKQEREHSRIIVPGENIDSKIIM
jgi:hypothetical protein